MSVTILVAYASGSGSTAEVASVIGEVLKQGDTAVSITVKNVKDVETVDGYTAVVLGSSIRAGRWLPEALDFLAEQSPSLAKRPVAYFTTCLTMVNDDNNSRRIVLRYMQPVLRLAPQITPVGLGLFAGSLDPDRQLITTHGMGPQGDFRDWKTIRAWASRVRPALLAGAAAPGQPVVLANTILSFTDMSGLDLSEANLRNSELEAANLSQANLQEADLSEANLADADLQQADLSDAALNWAELPDSNLQAAQLAGANMIGADLQNADLQQADLSKATLNGANFQEANLRRAILRYADLNWADFREADLRGADLRSSNLGWANLDQADLANAQLEGAKYNHYTKWPPDFSPEAAGCVLVNAPV